MSNNQVSADRTALRMEKAIRASALHERSSEEPGTQQQLGDSREEKALTQGTSQGYQGCDETP